MEVGTAAVAFNTLLGVVSKLANNPNIDTSVADIQQNKNNALNVNANLIGGLSASKLNSLFAVNGNMITLKKDVIVEPLLVISESAFDSKEYDKIGNMLLDIFTNHYADTYNTLQNVYGLDSQTIISVLGTDNGYSKLKSMAVSKVMNLALNETVKLLHESGMSTSYDDLLALDMDVEDITHEASVPTSVVNLGGNIKAGKLASNPVEYIKDAKNGVLGQTMLERRIMVTLRPYDYSTIHDPNDINSIKGGENVNKSLNQQYNTSIGKVVEGFRIPITIRARLLKVTPENIAQVAEPHKKFNTLTTWLDVKAGLAGFFSDYLLQRDAVKKYRKNLFKGNDFLKTINERKLSAYSKVATTAVVGFELNYTLLLITQKDKQLLDRYLNINIFKPNDKNDFLSSVFALTCAVLDDDSEIATFLTPQLDGGINSVTYRELRKFSGQKDYDIGDLLMAITKSRMLG